MSKLVSFSTGEIWTMNGLSWHRIMEHGKVGLDPVLRDRFAWELDAIGVDFADMSDTDAVQVASWLARTIDDMPDDPRWVTRDSRRYLTDLVGALNDERRRRGPA